MSDNPSEADDNQDIEIEGVRVTHPNRVLYPGQGTTKCDLIDHYLSVANQILPYLKDRPLSLLRCPKGQRQECFFQKHAGDEFPDTFGHVAIEEKSSTGDYLYIKDSGGLVGAVQMGVLELHIWGARVDRLDRPDRLVFDLDPDENIDFSHVKDAAREIRDRLQTLEVQSFLLATGGKGLHVVVPHDRRHDWDKHKDFAELMARRMADDSPDRYTVSLSKNNRKGKVFIDYLRNTRGNTAIAPFSSRARPSAPVAFPLPWRSLRHLKAADTVEVGVAARRFKQFKTNPWIEYGNIRQILPIKALGR